MAACQRARRLAALGLFAAALAGCSTVPYDPSRIQDPLEPLNRASLKLNLAVDRHVSEPVSKAYVAAMPKPARVAATNFARNLRSPYIVANDLLQLSPVKAFRDTARFVVNSTVGVGGLLDPATKIGLNHREQNFGLTAARWGLPEGPYLVLPLIGPHTVSSLPDVPLRLLANPVLFLGFEDARAPVGALAAVDALANTRSERRRLREAMSPYAFLRNGYYQRQRSLLLKGSIDDSPLFDPLPLEDLEEGLEGEGAGETEEADRGAGEADGEGTEPPVEAAADGEAAAAAEEQ